MVSRITIIIKKVILFQFVFLFINSLTKNCSASFGKKVIRNAPSPMPKRTNTTIMIARATRKTPKNKQSHPNRKKKLVTDFVVQHRDITSAKYAVRIATEIHVMQMGM